MAITRTHGPVRSAVQRAALAALAVTDQEELSLRELQVLLYGPKPVDYAETRFLTTHMNRLVKKGYVVKEKKRKDYTVPQLETTQELVTQSITFDGTLENFIIERTSLSKRPRFVKGRMQPYFRLAEGITFPA